MFRCTVIAFNTTHVCCAPISSYFKIVKISILQTDFNIRTEIFIICTRQFTKTSIMSTNWSQNVWIKLYWWSNRTRFLDKSFLDMLTTLELIVTKWEIKSNNIELYMHTSNFIAMNIQLFLFFFLFIIICNKLFILIIRFSC